MTTVASCRSSDGCGAMNSASQHHRPVFPEGIYLVTDPGLTMSTKGCPQPASTEDNAWYEQAIDETVDVVRRVIDVGVTMVQLRWKNVDALYFLELTHRICALAHPNVTLVVNDRVDVFMAARARGDAIDGVHVGQTDLPADTVRAMIGDDALIGLSASHPDELAAADALGDTVDSLGVGIVHPTSSKDTPLHALGVEGVDEIAASTRFPVTAIGGITCDDVPALARSHVHNVAVISAILGDKNPVQQAEAFVRAWQTHRKLRG